MGIQQVRNENYYKEKDINAIRDENMKLYTEIEMLKT